MKTYKKVVTNMLFSFQNIIHLTKLEIFALEDFYENSIKTANKLFGIFWMREKLQ